MLKTIDKNIQKAILAGGAHLDAIYYCPHHPEAGNYPYKRVCNCRKPAPGMIVKAQKDLNIDLKQSYTIGDKTSDIEAGINAGTKPILVLTGRGQEEQKKLADKKIQISQDLGQVVDQILAGQISL